MLGTTVAECATRHGDAAAFIADEGWSLTYTQLDALSNDVAAGLAARGVVSGAVVGLAMPSAPDYVVAYVALAKLGAVTAGANPRLAPGERAACFRAADVDLIIGTAELLEGCGAEMATIVVTAALRSADEILPELRNPDVEPASMVTSHPEDPVAICFTSGTTGVPKPAFYTNAQLEAIVEIDTGGRWGGGGAMIASTAFGHVGFMTKLPWYLRTATTMLCIHRWKARRVLELVHTHRVPVLGAVAPQVALMLRDPDFDGFDLDCVGGIIAGAGPSSPTLVAEARRRFGCGYSIRYSSTESGGVGLGTAFDASDEEALNTVGRPRPGVTAAVLDPDGSEVPPGTIGELVLRSAAMMAGYWNAPDATAATLKNGWLHTGDLALIDEAGCFRLAGRIKEMFVRGGYNVYPMEVEQVLATAPGVGQIAIVPRPDDVMGEIGVAVVVPDGEPPTLASLLAHADGQLARYKLPEALRVVEELPLTSMSKLDRRKLAEAESTS